MKKISIDELINMVDSSYSLVTIVSRRARQIIDGSQVLIDTDTTKPVAIAIEEFYEGAYQPIYDYDQYKKKLEEAEAALATIPTGDEVPEGEKHDNGDEFAVKEGKDINPEEEKLRINL